MGSQNVFSFSVICRSRIYEKSVLHVASRMVGGKIKRFKVVIIVFDFRSVGNSETDADENFLYFVEGLCDWMFSADVPFASGEW